MCVCVLWGGGGAAGRRVGRAGRADGETAAPPAGHLQLAEPSYTVFNSLYSCTTNCAVTYEWLFICIIPHKYKTNLICVSRDPFGNIFRFMAISLNKALSSFSMVQTVALLVVVNFTPYPERFLCDSGLIIYVNLNCSNISPFILLLFSVVHVPNQPTNKQTNPQPTKPLTQSVITNQ